jgi:signal transduction histidine kinase
VPDLVDRDVTVTGVLLAETNARRQFTGGGTIHSSSAGDLRVSDGLPTDAFEVPLVALRDVMSFSPAGPNLHRQRVRGVVTLSVPGRYLFLQDEEGASLKVNASQTDPLERGETVEAVGFVYLNGERAEMFDGLVHKVDQVITLEPLITTMKELVNWSGRDVFSAQPDYDGRLVTLGGRLLAVNWPTKEMPRLMLESGETLTPVDFSASGDFSRIRNLRLGSELSVTGVCSLTRGEGVSVDGQPQRRLSLVLQSLDDLRVIRAASWWTQGRLLTALAVASTLLLFLLGWSALLRRAVEVKSAKLASEMRARRDAKIEFESTLRERNRLAADLHDSTEQALTGLAMQLEISQALQESDPKRSKGHLSLATQMLDRSREDLRRSIWNLRANSLDNKSFLGALQEVAADRSVGSPIQVSVESEGNPRTLGDVVAGNLILLTQEGITNALKHAQAGRIGLKVVFEQKTVSLTIWDDGIGFDPQTAAGLREGHFGLQGMRERIKRLSGSIEIRSAAGEGTSVIATVPA